MKRKNLPEDRRLMHILVGKPDDDCEICRAHGLNGHELPEGAPGMVVLDMGPLDELLGCPCPLCSQLDFELLDGDRQRDPEDPRDA